MMKSQSYSINGRDYTFKPLVIGQYRQLAEVEFEVSEEMSDRDLFKTFISNSKASKILAIALAPVNYHMSEKDIDTLEIEIDNEFTPTQLEQIIDNFFGFCPLESILEDMTKVAKSGQRLRPLI